MPIHHHSGMAKTTGETSIQSGGVIYKLEISLVAESPRIDGVIDDAAWKNAPLPLGEWLTYNPVYGKQIVQRTQVWAAYDQTGLYFTFHCMDPEPEKNQNGNQPA
jgi:hypothetical protein